MSERLANRAVAEASAGFSVGGDAVAPSVTRALAGTGPEASVVLLFPSGIEPELAVAQARSVAGGVPVVGMTGNGSIGAEAASTPGCSALALGGGWDVGIGCFRGAGRSVRRAARYATAEALRGCGAGSPSPLLILMVDTRSGDQAEALAGAYAAAGPSVPIVGGASGGEAPAQLSGRSAHTDSVLAVAIRGKRSPGIGVAHGCRRVGPTLIATRTGGRFLQEIDGRPAYDVYLEVLGLEAHSISKEEFAVITATHPLAQPELSGGSRIRHVLGRGPKGSLECATPIPESAAIEFTRQRPTDVVDAARRAMGKAVEGLGAAPRAALVFDCAGRKRSIAGALDTEVAALVERFEGNPPPLAGVFSHGELARSNGSKGDKNHAVVVAALA